MLEIWKVIKGYEGKYEVSNLGRIKSLKRIDTNNHPIPERILKQSKYKTEYKAEYMHVSLCKEGMMKKFWVNRIVAKAFIPNQNNKPEVNHKNEITDDNRSINLEWVTPKENSNYGTRNARLAMSRSKQVLQYDKNLNLINVWNSAKETTLGGFSQGCVNLCCNGKRKTHKGFMWSFKELAIERR